MNVCYCTLTVTLGHPLVVQHAGGCAPIELLLLQDALKILHSLLQVPHMSWQVAVEKADRVAEYGHPGTDAPFISLRSEEKKK